MSNYHKTCIHCQRPFVTTNGHKKTCSKECESAVRTQNLNRRWSKVECKNVCRVCGKKFRRTGNRTTCSQSCAKINHQRTSKFSDQALEAKKVMQSKAETQEYHTAKEWRLRSPDGEVYVFKNVIYFVKEYAFLFTPEELEKGGKYPNAAYGLWKLSPDRKKRLLIWHGWTWANEG